MQKQPDHVDVPPSLHNFTYTSQEAEYIQPSEKQSLSLRVLCTMLSFLSAWPRLQVRPCHPEGITDLARTDTALRPKEVSCRLTFVALSRVTSLKGLLFIEKLDWERVKKLGGKFL